MNADKPSLSYPAAQQAATDELRDQTSKWADDDLNPEQLALLRSMSGERRLKMAEALFWSARKLKAAAVRNDHPHWSEDEIKAEVNRIFLNARS